MFKYRKRMIRSSKIRKNSNNIYYFYDPLLRGKEESSLLRRVKEKEITMEKYEQGMWNNRDNNRPGTGR
ncbi:MAG: hypothetical protein ACP5L4_03875 [Thermoplasmata archaeon]